MGQLGIFMYVSCWFFNMSSARKILLTLVAVSMTITLSSCSTILYYQQSASGQLQLLRAQQDLTTILQSPDTSTELKQRLQIIAGIRNFASDILKLPNNNSYRSYADIGRRYIVWNIFVTPALSMEPHKSCFLLVGCLSYRGYFKKKDALAYVDDMEKKNFDVYLGGVTAYSTLGWFNDPILNGMLERSDIELARLIFHELAHQQLYIRDDTEFNEAFADAVALIGLDSWLEAHTTEQQRHKFERELIREEQFTTLVLSYRKQLTTLFQSDIADAYKLAKKKSIYRELQQEYESLRTAWGGHNEYDNWFAHKLNNAKLAAVSTYRNLVPLFLTAYKASGKDMTAFYSRMEKIGHCKRERRRELLRSTSLSYVC